MVKLNHEHKPTPMLIGSRLYILEGSTIIVTQEELTDYHRREYNYYTKDTLSFTDVDEAKKMWYLLRSFFNNGYEECQRDLKRIIDG